ncbi:amino acid transporter [Nadsonia fulvescens var. elongata DSM 6958]|uniref:Amino acid transporter n=1 Tax=Nadsonia fulvescens var. elongata DSM 6958 TaxID=857566 RepID=A0A1E3PP93_9ASCO|nr:amino acid transporter [Nadsonia fulvescens var. elongata DSM 6958]
MVDIFETLPSIGNQKPDTESLKDGFKDIIFGSIAGMTGKLVEYPVDTVKVRLQSQPLSGPLHFEGPFDCFVKTFREEGLRGFYRGLTSPLVAAALENASLFVTYNYAQDFLIRNVYRRTDTVLPVSVLVGCGAFSGAVTSFVLTPVELIKCKLQVQAFYGTSSAAKNRSLVYHIKQIFLEHGLRGFWKGHLGTFIRECGGTASWFGSYEYVSSLFRSANNCSTNTTPEAIISGACAGIGYNISLYPADTIKSRMQTMSITSGSDKGGKGFLEVSRDIYKSGGISAFYRGCGITACRAAPSSALIFVTYETLKEWGRDL